MLSMVIFRFDPENREEVLKRRSEEQSILDASNIGEWYSVETNQVFRLIEGGNLRTAMEAFRTWGHLWRIEIVPVKNIGEPFRRTGQ
jgi:hypothetical protein